MASKAWETLVELIDEQYAPLRVLQSQEERTGAETLQPVQLLFELIPFNRS